MRAVGCVGCVCCLLGSMQVRLFLGVGMVLPCTYPLAITCTSILRTSTSPLYCTRCYFVNDGLWYYFKLPNSASTPIVFPMQDAVLFFPFPFDDSQSQPTLAAQERPETLPRPPFPRLPHRHRPTPRPPPQSPSRSSAPSAYPSWRPSGPLATSTGPRRSVL